MTESLHGEQCGSAITHARRDSFLDTKVTQVYEHLDSACGEIWLCSIAGILDDGTLLLVLRKANLQTARLSFYALSYCWGRAKRLGSVRVNGSQKVDVTANLYKLLKMLDRWFPGE
jgi:hypothetical protein